MRSLIPYLIVILLIFSNCQSSEISSEKEPLVQEINDKVSHIDRNHRVRIVEDDFVRGDSIYKVRGYFMDKSLLKVVGILRTQHFERDDYFYFEDHAPLFSGHMMNYMDDQLAVEYKYYYKDDKVVEALRWSDHYEPGKRFPHEHFVEFEPDRDSLIKTEKKRLDFFLELLDKEGIEIKHLNENLGANQ